MTGRRERDDDAELINRRWAKEADEALIAMKRAGQTDLQIAEALGRTRAAISARWSYLRKTDQHARDVPKAKRNLQPGAKRAKRGAWGLPNETRPVGEVVRYEENGVVVTRYPVGWARGVWPGVSAMPNHRQ